MAEQIKFPQKDVHLIFHDNLTLKDTATGVLINYFLWGENKHIDTWTNL